MVKDSKSRRSRPMESRAARLQRRRIEQHGLQFVLREQRCLIIIMRAVGARRRRAERLDRFGPHAAIAVPRHEHDEAVAVTHLQPPVGLRSEEHTSELQSLMRISYAVFCLKNKKNKKA